MSTDTTAVDLLEIWKNLEDASAGAYSPAEREEAAAQKAATTALNRLNAAQKSFDAATAKVRTFAPSRSEWAIQPHRKVGAST